uniref:Uncharacterized protein n=1 Tax=Sphaerodactylus townsendi TaxID=933632 RepID=A0ACB8EQC9_9SAUR
MSTVAGVKPGATLGLAMAAADFKRLQAQLWWQQMLGEVPDLATTAADADSHSKSSCSGSRFQELIHALKDS